MYDVYLKRKFERNCKTICQKAVNYFKEHISEKEYIFDDKILGKIKSNLVEKEITIEFMSLNEKIKIFKRPITFQNINGQFEVYDEENLKAALNNHNEGYIFYCNDKMVDSNEILNNRPPIVFLIPKNTIDFKYFEPLNEKEEMKKDKKSISISTNKLITLDMNSLNLNRNNDFEVILKDRTKFFEIINQFLKSSYKILKIYGSDGIGKSISFIYYTHLKNEYKILYFNLKELFNKIEQTQIDIMIHQLMNYFTINSKIKNKNNKDFKTQKEIAFENFKDKVNEIKNIIIKNNKFDFWKILQKLIEEYFFRYKTLLIFDQYKTENNQHENLQRIENLLISNQKLYNNIKILISSSINDYGVKLDFELDLYALSQIYKSNSNDNKENKNSKGVFKSSSENEKENNSFFEEIVKHSKSDNFIERKKMIENQLVQIIYINELISVQNLNDKENKNIMKMSDFNYNPKYYFKFKEYYLDNFPIFNEDEIYVYFTRDIFNKLSEKIKNYYLSYSKNSKYKYNQMSNYITDIQNKIQNKDIFTFNNILEILNKIPWKYIKILELDENNNIKKDDNNIIFFNKDILNSKFQIDYLFPFIKFVFARLNFDLETININNISPSGIGSILEKLILKAIFTHKTYGEFNYRKLYSFVNTDKSQLKSSNEESDIDIFNFRKLIYDDIKENLLVEKLGCYYICPKIPTNEFLDSIILIPPKVYNSNKMEYWIICLQITINKTKNLKSLSEYQLATINAAKLIEKIYKIKLIQKLFLFVLLKDYDNIETQNLLKKEGIPFIFFSASKNKFYFNEKLEIKSIRDLIKDEYVIIDKPIENEIIANKIGNFRIFQEFLNRKRYLENKETITDEEYYMERRKKYPNDEPIKFPKDVEKKINLKIKNILKLKYDANIKYAFVSPFYKIDGLCDKKDFFGLIFFKSEIYIYFNNKLYNINEQNSDLGTEGKSLLDGHIYSALSDQINITDEYGQTYDQEKKYQNLIKYYQNKPSSIYVYYLE